MSELQGYYGDSDDACGEIYDKYDYYDSCDDYDDYVRECDDEYYEEHDEVYDEYDLYYDNCVDDYDEYEHSDEECHEGCDEDYDEYDDHHEEYSDEVSDDDDDESDDDAGVYRWYGYFRCPKCKRGWESSQVYKKTNGEFYEQACTKCHVYVKPYDAEPIRCSRCGLSGKHCTCKRGGRRDRHVDVNKPHRSDLCSKCLNGNPCVSA